MGDEPPVGPFGGPQRYSWEGQWNTRQRRLSGIMRCDAIKTDKVWKARFHGVWQGQAFSYLVYFDGEDKLVGRPCVIDGAYYKWTGEIKDGYFFGYFSGNRYDGSFKLKAK